MNFTHFSDISQNIIEDTIFLTDFKMNIINFQMVKKNLDYFSLIRNKELLAEIYIINFFFYFFDN